jgi:hypothetical protein
MLVGGFFGGSAGSALNISSPPLTNERADAADSSTVFISIEVSDDTQAAAGASGTKGGTSSTSSRFVYIMAALRPAAAATGFTGWGIPI